MIRVPAAVTLSLLAILTAGCLMTRAAAAQSDGAVYVKIDYMKAATGAGTDYVKAERELWKPIHEERRRRGIISSWNLYGVMAGEPEAPYDYVAVNVFDDFGKIDYYRLGDILAAVHPGRDPEEILRRTESTREVVRTEIWQIEGTVLPEGASVPAGSYITVNYFDARGGSGEHAAMELEFWGRIHEARVDRNILNGWAMYTLIYPGGDARHYTYSTIDYYDALGDLREPVGMALARVAHPDLTDDELSDYFSRTGASRTLYKTELWKRIDSVDGDQER